ncbi:uncharacterized protein V1510DRAFT_399142 [Dipodascopsis tothii]|uniref:uncharacterized protein n=1 Tax=Dipodascopsis tothii TaxID=44089 RepID=UPI0034CED765
MSLPQFAIPGQPLASTAVYASGAGTYVSDGQVVASLLGRVSTAPPAADRPLPQISVGRPAAAADATGSLPAVGDVVLARVVKIDARQANVLILVVGSGVADAATAAGLATDPAAADASAAGAGPGKVVAKGEYGGIIRSQDVRATEKDKVKIVTSFRPGDIVRAQVVSLGDGTNYYLTTARNDLGVVFAVSQAGEPMYPVDWRTMKCPKTGLVEERKCAKPT